MNTTDLFGEILPAADDLSAIEPDRLVACEARIERGLQTFVEVGNALLEIRDSRLYRQQFPTFEAYCRERWRLSRPRAYELLNAASVVANVSAIADIVPTTESQARPLTRLEPEMQRAVWQEVVETTPPEKITAKVVEEKVRAAAPTDLTPFSSPITAPTFPATPAPAVSPESIAAMLASLPAETKRAVIDATVADDGLKVVRADARYLHVSQSRHEWYTPAEYLEAARYVMGDIDLDPASCAIAQETVKAARFYSKEQDGLAQPWAGRVWMNPPFESELIRPFVAKLLSEYRAGAVEQAIILTDNATDTSWFHDLSVEALGFCFTKGRIKLRSPLTDSQAPQRGQVFTYLGRSQAGFNRFKERFADIGLVVVEAAP